MISFKRYLPAVCTLVAMVSTSTVSAETVAGDVRDYATDEPVAAVVVTARRSDRQSAALETATASDGTYVLDLPPGSYRLTFQKARYSPSPAERPLRIPRQKPERISVELFQREQRAVDYLKKLSERLRRDAQAAAGSNPSPMELDRGYVKALDLLQFEYNASFSTVVGATKQIVKVEAKLPKNSLVREVGAVDLGKAIVIDKMVADGDVLTVESLRHNGVDSATAKVVLTAKKREGMPRERIASPPP